MLVFLLTACLAAQLVSPQTPTVSTKPIDFHQEVQPILNNNCTACHTGSIAPARLHLDSPEGIANGSESGKVIVPGSSKDSLLVRRITEKTMPPTAPLSVSDIAVITAWVDQGAKMPAATETSTAIDKKTGKTFPASPQHAMLNQYYATCHNKWSRMFDRLDSQGVGPDAQQWELIVRKLRAGMMPPSGNPRPAAARLESFIVQAFG